MPPDSRVPLTPAQCRHILDEYEVEIAVQPATGRCYSDGEYRAFRIPIEDDLQEYEVLLGVKEVPIPLLIPHKTYLFFSHTIKKQAYNRDLLRAILDKGITLIDYEALTDERGKRLIAFGKFAGMVGAHNSLFTYAQRTGAFELKQMKEYHDYADARSSYDQLRLPPLKIALTGTGRVGLGAALVLRDMGIREVSVGDFLTHSYEEAVFAQLHIQDYIRRPDNTPFEHKEYYARPDQFESAFAPFTRVADIMINGIYWDNRAPRFFTREDMQSPDFKIQVIADITCDIAPVSSIPSTLRASTIADPVFGYEPHAGVETAPYQEGCIDMMTIDNLPNELPRDASQAFGEQFIEHILPEFFRKESAILERATVARNGQLGPHFQYLAEYAGV